MRLWAAVTMIAIALAGAGDLYAQSAKSNLEDPAQALRFNDISDKLVCQCGCNMILRVCNHFECPSALPMRAKLEEQILAGMTDEAIVADFVGEYGKVILSAPTAKGVDLAAWVMPGFAVLLGLGFIAYLLLNWAAKKKANTRQAVVGVDPAVASRIEAELKGMEK